MSQLVRQTLYIFLGVFVLTTLLSTAGLIKTWFFSSSLNEADLPYLRYLLFISIAEAVAVVLLFAKRGLKFLPEVLTHKSKTETLTFMKDFVSGNSTVQIVSSRASWIKNSKELLDSLKEMSSKGSLIEIFTPAAIEEQLREELTSSNIKFYVTGEGVPPEARFTLINGSRSSAERLAIARGHHPKHEVTIFDNDSGPQIIGMAKDIIRKSRILANDKPME